MSKRDQERIVAAKRQLTIARGALDKIKHGCRFAESVAELALDKMSELDPDRRPLQGIVGHGEKR